MPKTYSVFAVRSAATSALTNQFTRNLMISILMTGCDGSVVITADAASSTPSMKLPGWRLRLVWLRPA
jgi:hypothetical protein